MNRPGGLNYQWNRGWDAKSCTHPRHAAMPSVDSGKEISRKLRHRIQSYQMLTGMPLGEVNIQLPVLRFRPCCSNSLGSFLRDAQQRQIRNDAETCIRGLEEQRSRGVLFNLVPRANDKHCIEHIRSVSRQRAGSYNDELLTPTEPR